MWTLLLYLNDDFGGGETAMVAEDRGKSDVLCVPEVGSVLIFDHDILHEGREVCDGCKYVVRTDVIFSPP